MKFIFHGQLICLHRDTSKTKFLTTVNDHPAIIFLKERRFKCITHSYIYIRCKNVSTFLQFNRQQQAAMLLAGKLRELKYKETTRVHTVVGRFDVTGAFDYIFEGKDRR